MGKVQIKLLAAGFIVSAVVGCESKHAGTDSVMIDLNAIDRDSIAYSEFVDSISYVSLDPDKNCVISNIRNVVFADSCMAVFDDKAARVLLMDRNGNYIRNIGSRGRGSGEFMHPLQIDIDRARGLVLVYDGIDGTVLKYGFDNRYVGKDSIGYGDDMSYVGDGRYLLANHNDNTDKAGIFLIETSPYRSTKVMGCRDKLPIRKPWELFRNGNDVSYMSRQYEDILAKWNGEVSTIEVEFQVSPSPSESDIRKIEEMPRERKKHADRVLFCDGDRWFYTYFWVNNSIRYIFWDKKDDVVTVTTLLKNDIDGTYGMELPVAVDGSFVKVVEGDSIDNQRLQFLHLKK